MKSDGSIPLLETRRLAMKFGGLIALDQVDFKVPRGELRALIGPNGAGKTTLFNVITGVLKPTSGRVIFEGQDLVGRSSHEICRRGLSRSFQLTNIFPELMVWENVWLGTNAKSHLRWNPISRVSRRSGLSPEVEQICRQVGLGDKMEGTAGNLSHGDQKLLEMAIVLSLDPKMLLLDEPTQGVSPHEVEVINNVIKHIALTRTVLLIDHNMSTVQNVAQVVSVLHHGGIITEGPPEVVVKDRRVQEVYLGTGQDQCLVGFSA